MPEPSIHDIQRLGHRGDGIADGPVFAARTLPGEQVAGQLVGDRLESIKIVLPSENRVSPPCPHYAGCGGCDLLHAGDEFVEKWKVGLVRSALAEQGLKTEIRGIVTSPPGSRRRASIAARRTKSGALAGFHGRRSGVIASIPNCRVLTPDLVSFLPAAEALAQAGASRKQALTLAVSGSENGPDVHATDGKPLDGPMRQVLAAIAQKWGVSRLAWGEETIVVLAQPLQTFDGIPVVPPPGAFLQATRHGERTLLGAVREIVGDASKIIDMFAGCGTFSLPLCRTAAVHAVEGVGAMLSAADDGWRSTPGLKPLTTERRDLFRNPFVAHGLNRFSAAVIDPPRSGAEAQMRELAKSTIPFVASVSCNPITFARDARILADGGYRLEWIQVVDQFRWSAHTELVAHFAR